MHILGFGWFKRPSADFLDQECKIAYGSQWRVWEAEHWQEWLYAVWAGNCEFVLHHGHGSIFYTYLYTPWSWVYTLECPIGSRFAEF